MLILTTVLKLFGGDSTTIYMEVVSVFVMWTHCGQVDFGVVSEISEL